MGPAKFASQHCMYGCGIESPEMSKTKADPILHSERQSKNLQIKLLEVVTILRKNRQKFEFGFYIEVKKGGKKTLHFIIRFTDEIIEEKQVCSLKISANVQTMCKNTYI